jgi:hypothetical protein
MRPYQKWLSLGLLALTPNIAFADAVSPTAKSAANAPAQKKKGVSNQELAERVAQALRKAKLSHYEIDIDARSGVVTLVGKISRPEQRKAAENAVGAVPGVSKIINRLEVVESRQKADVQHAVATMPRQSARNSRVQQVDGRSPAAGLSPDQDFGPPGQFAGPPGQFAGPPGQFAGPPGQFANGPAGMPGAFPQDPRIAFAGTAPAQMAATPVAAPQGSIPGTAGGHAMYNQPNFPNNAWPTYAQYPNYSAVSYPTQYSASAWPYIGPFYPYPQVPLGWRKATLEWDDGYWNLNFRARTDRWWWFLDPKNW